jgi:hypothetical protein
MAVKLPVLEMSFIAEEDLSDYQYHFVSLSTTEGYVKAIDTTSEQVIGILQNKPTLGESAEVMIIGVSKVVAGEGLNPNDVVDAEFISATDSGKAINYVAGGDKLGIVIIAASAEDKLASILLTI